MSRLPLSPAAARLLRGLLARCGKHSDRILLIDCQSVDWQSLTFVGERHRLTLRLTGPDSEALRDSLCGGLDEAEVGMPGQILADIVVIGEPERAADGSLTIVIEALTVED